MTPPQAALFSLAALCFGTFIAGVWWVFERRGEVEVGLLWIKAGALCSAALELWALATAEAIPPWRSGLGLGLFISSLALFCWCAHTHAERPLLLAFSKAPPSHLVRRGPYRVVRHPFYTSYLLSYLAGFIASGNSWLMSVVVAMTGLYWLAALHEESQFRTTPFAEAYRHYREQTGMFLPTQLLQKATRAGPPRHGHRVTR